MKKKYVTEQQIETKVDSSKKDEVALPGDHHNIRPLLTYVETLPNESHFDLVVLTATGIEFKYPPCCIMDFVNDVAKNETPAIRALDTLWKAFMKNTRIK